MRIAFVSPKSKDVSLNRLLGAGLGGNETTYVLWAERLASLGHEVSVFSHVSSGRYDTLVHYADIENYRSGLQQYDLLVGCRDPQTLSGARRATRQVFMLGDRNVEGLSELSAETCDFVYATSQTQYSRFRPLINQQIGMFIGSCGVDDEIFCRDNKKIGNTFLHSSVPYRGLNNVLRLWPMILEEMPDAHLHVTGGYKLWGYTDEEAAYHLERDEIKKNTALTNVTFHGPVPRNEYKSILSLCQFFLYITDYEEMCCISALEAAASGGIVIVSGVAALTERVWHGVTGISVSPECTDDGIIREIVDVASDPETVRIFGENAASLANHYKTSLVVERFLNMLVE